jgi:hypothetical protein
MSQTFKYLALLSVAILNSACVGPLPKIEASPTSLESIKTIAVIRPPEPELYTLVNFGHAGLAALGGVLGGAVASGLQGSTMAQVTEALKRENPSLISQGLPENIARELNKRGYEAKIEDGPWERNEEGAFKFQFDKTDSSADGVLVIIPTIVGFVSTGLTEDYKPTVIVGVTLLGKNRDEKLYRGFHASGWEPKGEGWRHSEPKLTFSNLDSILSDQSKAAASLTNAAANIGLTVAEDLRR